MEEYNSQKHRQPRVERHTLMLHTCNTAELPEIRTQGTKLSEQVSSLQLDRALTAMALLSLLGKDIRMQLGTTLFFK